MSKIFIKKQSGNNLDNIPSDLKVDLRKKSVNQKQPSKTWLFLSIFLFAIIIALALNLWFLSSEKVDFVNLIPKETIVFSIINKDALYPQIFPFKSFLEENNFYGQKAIKQFNDYLDKAHLNFESDIQSFFEKEIAFIVLSSNPETEFPFAMILKSEVPRAQFSQILDKIEPEFKKDYNFSAQTYRQVKVISLKSFSNTQFNYTYAYIGNYFIISNSQECLKNIVDNIIDK